MSPTWETAADWDANQSDGNYTSGAGVGRHEASQTGFPTAGDATLEKGPPSTVLPSKSPVGFWPAAEDSGSTIADASGTLDMDAITGTTISASGGPLDTGYRSYDGNDDAAKTTGTASLTGSHTMGSFIRTTDTTNFAGIVTTDGADSGAYSQFVLYDAGDDPGHGMRVQIVDSSGNEKRATSNSAFNDGAWHLVGFVFDQSGDTLSFYIDGSSVGFFNNVNNTLTYSSTTPFQLGLTRDDFRNLTGDLAYSFVADTAWTDADWASLYQTFV